MQIWIQIKRYIRFLRRFMAWCKRRRPWTNTLLTPIIGNSNIGINNNTLSTPAPTRTPTSTPSVTPTRTATPVRTPTPQSNTNTNSAINVGQINGRATRLLTPKYTRAARNVRASGRVIVRVLVDENGNVASARATSGHPLLRKSAETAALRSKFRPVIRNGRRVKSIGTVVYRFVN